MTTTEPNSGDNDNTPVDHDYEIILFEDADLDGIFDPDTDNPVGLATVPAGLVPGGKETTAITVSAKALFGGNRISAFADGSDAVHESDELDNVAHNMGEFWGHNT